MIQITNIDSNEIYFDDIKLECSMQAKLYRKCWCIETEQSNEFYTDICTFYSKFWGEGSINIDDTKQLEIIKNAKEIMIKNDNKTYWLYDFKAKFEDNVVKFKIEKED